MKGYARDRNVGASGDAIRLGKHMADTPPEAFHRLHCTARQGRGMPYSPALQPHPMTRNGRARQI